MDRVLLVRHGHYTKNPERLTELGKEQARKAAYELSSYELGKRTVFIASTAPRTLQTMEEIAATLYLDHTYQSKMLYDAGNVPELADDPRTFFPDVVAAQHLDPDLIDNLVVVTHGPLIDRFKAAGSAAHGEVVPYKLD